MERKTALITGASSGIGLDLAHLFGADRWNLVLVARSEGKLRETAAELEKKCGIYVTVLPVDLAKPDAAHEIVDQLAAKGIEIEALVNNAGFGGRGAFWETEERTELDMLQVNIVALTQLTRLLLPPMVARNSGRILNVASTAAFQPGPYMAVYYASKAYVLSLSEAVADELRDTGVTVTALCPGPTATGFAAVAGTEGSKLFRLSKPMSSDDVAQAGYKAMLAGRRLVVTGMKNKLLAQAVRVSPRRMVTTIARKMQE